MDTAQDNRPAPLSPTGWDVPEVLRTLVSPLTFCGLVAVGLVSLGAAVLYSDLSAELKFAGFVAALVGEAACFVCVIRKVKDSKTLVLDADYHKQLLVTRFIEGNALNDFVDDRVLVQLGRIATERGTEDWLKDVAAPPDSGSTGRGASEEDRRLGPPDRRVRDGGRRTSDVAQ